MMCCAAEVWKLLRSDDRLLSKRGSFLVYKQQAALPDSLHIVGRLIRKGFVLPESWMKICRSVCGSLSGNGGVFASKTCREHCPAISLVSEAGLTTAYANDRAPDLAFAQQQVLGKTKPGMCFGKFPLQQFGQRIVRDRHARALHVKTIGLTGHTGGRSASLCDVCIKVPGVGKRSRSRSTTFAGIPCALYVCGRRIFRE